MDLDRGSCQCDSCVWSKLPSLTDLQGKNPLSYFAAMAISEIQWAELYAKPRMNPYRHISILETAEEYMQLLDKILQFNPYLASQDAPSQTWLSHPDLHLDNIFVDADTLKLTSVIDWQSAHISEPYFQAQIPRMIVSLDDRSRGSRGEDTINESSTTLERPDQSEDRTERLRAYYHQLTQLARQKHLQLFDVYTNPPPAPLQKTSSPWLLAKAASIVPGAWTRRKLFSLRHELIYVAARWDEDPSYTEPCPVDFTDNELSVHSNEWSGLAGVRLVLRELQNRAFVAPGGMVLTEHFETAVRFNQDMKKIGLEKYEDKRHKEAFEPWWPYPDLE